VEVTLFATKNSITRGKLRGVTPEGYEENPSIHPKVWECLHISELFEKADEFDLIHNNFDFLPLSYSGLVDTPVVTTIHGFSSPEILPVYKKYNKKVFYVAISEADRSPDLEYAAVIHHGIDVANFTFIPEPDDYLLYFGRIHRDKGADTAIQIARKVGKKLIMAGVIQDREYFEMKVRPYIDGKKVSYVGSVGPAQRNELLGKALALLHPINFKEPFGLSVVESMACGTPVIAFNRGSMPEIIRSGENGFLVEGVDEAVESASRLREIDRSRCREWVEQNFTVERMVGKYLKVYRQVIGKRKREDHRPWGFYAVLGDTENHKVKRITVYPGKRLSLQRHQRRSEHWHVVNGEALVTLDEKEIRGRPGQSVDIPRGATHRIENPGPGDLVFIEVQRGDYFGEDDIERLEDDFGRIG